MRVTDRLMTEETLHRISTDLLELEALHHASACLADRIEDRPAGTDRALDMRALIVLTRRGAAAFRDLMSDIDAVV